MISIAMDPRKRGPFRLKKISSSTFQIHQHSGPAFEGTRAMIFAKAEDMGVHGPDLAVAESEMIKYGHDCAEFGIGGKFMYTKLSSERNAA